ncbi:bchH, partial [Symbiodinium sp. CCMP2456]
DEEAAASRIFSNAAGEFGSLVNERVVAGNWENEKELGETWASRNAFAFGRRQRGESRTGVLDKLLGTAGSLVQLTDSVEYGLTDIQEYYANSGAMVRRMSDLQDKKVEALVVDTTQREVMPRKLDSVLRMEYRTKLLNPKWAEAMVSQGSGGAFEVSQRMTALLGWGGTARFAEDWVWDQSAQRYVFDEDMARRLKESNPEAFRNVVSRLLE